MLGCGRLLSRPFRLRFVVCRRNFGKTTRKDGVNLLENDQGSSNSKFSSPKLYNSKHLRQRSNVILNGHTPSSFNIRQPEWKETLVKYTELHLHLRSSMIRPRKTIIPKSRPCYKLGVVKDLPLSLPRQGLWFIPQNKSLSSCALHNVLSRMFKKSYENENITSNNADSISPNASTNFLGSSISPNFTFRPDVITPSPNFQIIRKLRTVRQLQRRSFSLSCIRQAGEGEPEVSHVSTEANSLSKKRDDHTRFRLLRTRIERHSRYSVLKKLSLSGPSITSASDISFHPSLKRMSNQHTTTEVSPDAPVNNNSNVASKSFIVARHLEEMLNNILDKTEQGKVAQDKVLPEQRTVVRVVEQMFASLNKDKNADSVTSALDRPIRDPNDTEENVDVTKPESPVFSLRTSGRLPQIPSGDSVLTDVLPMETQPPIARLAHGLDRVLFNQSVYWLQDPHSEVFNFSPDLQTLPFVTDFAFERLPGYKHSSEDDRLLDLAIKHKKPFVGSTSTLTKILSHIYFLLSEDKLVDISTLSMAYVDQSRRFTPGLRMPASFNLRPRLMPGHCFPVQQVYAVDSAPFGDQERQDEWNVLLWLGTMMEKFLTHPKEQFDSLRRENSPTYNFMDKPETYRYAKSSKFIMRSQLDCQDSRLPGTGVFDLKTRAVLPIRIDPLNLQQHSNYLIRQTTGLYESFEREYYDLIRTAFLKYNFQARIGNMDGVFVAYHNTARLFGFQYIPVTEMEARLYGPGHPDRGSRIFEKCVGLMEAIMERMIGCFPGYPIHCTMETKEDTNQLHIWVVPINYPAYPTPIEEFIITVRHTMNDIPVDGKIAVERAYQNWIVQYYITRCLDLPEQIWHSLKKCQRRAEFAMVVPEGVSMDQARAHLNSVNWKAGLGFQWDLNPENFATISDKELVSEANQTDDALPSSAELTGPKLTTRAHGLIIKLRKMAKKGFKEADSAVKEKPQVMWGRDPDLVDDTSHHLQEDPNLIDPSRTLQPQPTSSQVQDLDKPA